MKHVIVAHVMMHAEALLRWSKWDRSSVDLKLYGDQITDIYISAWIAPPITEVTEDQAYWIAAVLKPRVNGPIQTYGGWSIFPEQIQPLPIDLRGQDNGSNAVSVAL